MTRPTQSTWSEKSFYYKFKNIKSLSENLLYMFRVITEEPLELSGKVLIVPAVSVGNSGTLAIDLLLNSSIFKRKA